MTRGEFREALALAQRGMLVTDFGASQELRDILDQIAEMAPERDAHLDAAAGLEYRRQRLRESQEQAGTSG